MLERIEFREQERDVAELELQHLRNYLTSIIDSMPSVLVGVDPDCRITQWNLEAERVTGTGAPEAEGKPLAEAFPGLANEIDVIHEAMRTQEVRSNARRKGTQEAETRYEEVTVYPLLDDGVQGAVVRVDNVTERVRIEELFIQSEKMLSVGSLATGMAHEINNPLGGMIQTAAVMEDRLTNVTLPANEKAAERAGITMRDISSYMADRESFRCSGESTNPVNAPRRLFKIC